MCVRVRARVGFRAAGLAALHRQTEDRLVALAVVVVRVVDSAMFHLHSPPVFPDERVAVVVAIIPPATLDVQDLVPFSVVLGVLDRLSSDLSHVVFGAILNIGFLPELIPIIRYRVVVFPFHVRRGRLLELLIFCHMIAVPVDCLAPDVSVVVHVLDNVSLKSAVHLKLEVLHPPPWVFHADDVGHLVLVVDIQAVLALVCRYVATRVINLDVGAVVLHRLVMFGLFISVPCRAIELRIMELPLGAGKHRVVLPEFGNKFHLIKVDISGEERVCRVN